MAKKRTYREFKQGIFKPQNSQKCLNKENIVYRSGLELKLMLVLDKNPNVIQWSSEKVIIPYKHPVKSAQSGTPQYARYFVDFYMKLKVGEVIKEYLVEIKPERQCSRPTTHGNKKQSTLLYENLTFCVNTSKWEAARKWCENEKRVKNRDIEFIIITEKNIDTILGK
jgi:hypothetical protein